eukprot:TRINITY_DN49556_c0_g1_i1.p1 TRINITY_DN49556_c0_g1~~TRINITY_DN49556_c0_g1_i1.p1  ORF type:complete len:934 (-),score=161.44 TRINITY_DN49556_c0_g1_i1:106-2907(-)
MSSNPGQGPPIYTLPPEVEGRGGGRQGGRGPAPGSAWVKFRATQVLGGQAVGIFSASPKEQGLGRVNDQETQAEEVEKQARQCGTLSWELENVPPPDFVVVNDEIGSSFRAELSIFIARPPARVLKDVRVRGPRRNTIQEARKDGSELRRAVFRFMQDNVDFKAVLARLKEIEGCDWRPEDMLHDDISDDAERRLPEFTTATHGEKMREQADTPQTLKEWIYEKKEDMLEEYKPSGSHWVKAGQMTSTPRIPGIWHVHSRQKEDGKHVSWLFFNANTGKYYRALADGGTWVQTGVPHNPVQHPVKILHASACAPAKNGSKNVLAVALPELAKTGSALRQPLPFLDKPAALYLLTDGWRGSNVAAEFCARRFHTFFMPRLSARSTDLEDFEIMAIVNEAVECLDHALLDSSARYAGCAFALLVVLGRRLVIGSLGDCRVLLCRPDPQETAKPSKLAIPWTARQVVPTGRDVQEVARHRLMQAGGPLDFSSTGVIRSTSELADVIAGQPTEQDRVLMRVTRAAHPFAALGMRAADLQAGAAAVHQAVQDFEALAMPTNIVDEVKKKLAAAAYDRVREAARLVMDLLGLDAFATQLLAELLYVMDDEDGIPSQQCAAALLGVEPGCGEANVRVAIDRRYQALINQLSVVSQELVEQGLGTLAEVAEIAATKDRFWVPEKHKRSVRTTRGLGCRDMKRPRRLMGLELASQIMLLEQGASCFVLLSGGARDVSDEVVAKAAQMHKGRPRAMCLRVTAEASKMLPDEAVGAICAYVNVDDEVAHGIGADPSKGSDPKRRKLDGVGNNAKSSASKEPGKPAKTRLVHILLKFQGSSESDTQARRSAPPNRTQVDAERELVTILETLLKLDPKKLGAAVTALARDKSDCKSALNTPHADLGWVNPGQHGKEFDAAVADLQIGHLSDVVVTPRGAHLIYRLA